MIRYSTLRVVGIWLSLVVAQAGAQNDLTSDDVTPTESPSRFESPPTAQALAGVSLVELAARTNAGPVAEVKPQVVSASRGAGEPPAARWVLGPDLVFRAENAFFQAELAASLFVEDLLVVAVPGNKEMVPLRGSVLALAYRDTAGQVALIGWARPTVGTLDQPGQVVFRNAFEGVAADVVFTLTPHSVSQDVILRGGLPEPERFGVSPEAELAVVTEFYDLPPPVEFKDSPEAEPILRWGLLGMIRGHAFSLGSDQSDRVEVRKRWEWEGGRALLFESVSYGRLRAGLEALPPFEPSPPSEMEELPRQGLNRLPRPPAQGSPERDLYRPGTAAESLWAGVAPSDCLREPGVLIDYVLAVPVPVINIDFGYGQTKTGFSAVGQSESDVWNVCDLLTPGTVTDLQWSDAYLWSKGHNSYSSVTISNISLGRWHFPAPVDAMYDGYNYVYQGSITGSLNDLPADTYDIYFYGHGPGDDGNSVFTLNGVTRSTSSAGGYWNSSDWHEGEQYVVFRGVSVSAGQDLAFSAAPGVSGYSVLNGAQIVPVSQLSTLPSTTWEPSGVVAIPQQGAITFRASASGTAPLAYQWRKDGGNLAGATQPILTVLNVQGSHAGSYSVAVSNPAGTVLSGGVGLQVGQPACTDVPPDLAGWWAGDNSDNDQMLRHPMTRVNGAAFESAVAGYGFSFNGTSAYAMVSSTPDLNIGGSPGLTMEAWVQVADTAARPILEWGNSSTIGAHLWANYPSAAAIHANLVDTGGGSHAASAYNVLPVNTPTHLAVTYEKSTGYIRLYVNGLKRVEWLLGSFTPRTGVDFRLGHRAYAGGQAWFRGWIDEPALYGRCLTEAEIALVYRAGANGKCKIDADEDGLPDWWEMNNFGGLGQSATGDYDGDGLSNAQEYQSGSNPLVEGGSLQLFTPLQ